MKNILRYALSCAIVTCFTGCASIVGGHNQSLSVQTKQGGEALAGANCKLSNSKGTWFTTSPGSVTVRRAYGDLDVTCEKPDVPTGIAKVKSSTKPMAFGNILFGGLIGVGVDTASGAAYDYPPLIVVEMGETISLPEKPADAKAAQTSK